MKDFNLKEINGRFKLQFPETEEFQFELNNNKIVLLHAPRGWGKSTFCAALMIQTLLLDPDANPAIYTPTEKFIRPLKIICHRLSSIVNYPGTVSSWMDGYGRHSLKDCSYNALSQTANTVFIDNVEMYSQSEIEQFYEKIPTKKLIMTYSEDNESIETVKALFDLKYINVENLRTQKTVQQKNKKIKRLSRFEIVRFMNPSLTNPTKK